MTDNVVVCGWFSSDTEATVSRRYCVRSAMCVAMATMMTKERKKTKEKHILVSWMKGVLR
jgi:hypothetical protein